MVPGNVALQLGHVVKALSTLLQWTVCLEEVAGLLQNLLVSVKDPQMVIIEAALEIHLIILDPLVPGEDHSRQVGLQERRAREGDDETREKRRGSERCGKPTLQKEQALFL